MLHHLTVADHDTPRAQGTPHSFFVAEHVNTKSLALEITGNFLEYMKVALKLAKATVPSKNWTFNRYFNNCLLGFVNQIFSSCSVLEIPARFAWAAIRVSIGDFLIPESDQQGFVGSSYNNQKWKIWLTWTRAPGQVYIEHPLRHCEKWQLFTVASVVIPSFAVVHLKEILNC